MFENLTQNTLVSNDTILTEKPVKEVPLNVMVDDIIKFKWKNNYLVIGRVVEISETHIKIQLLHLVSFTLAKTVSIHKSEIVTNYGQVSVVNPRLAVNDLVVVKHDNYNVSVGRIVSESHHADSESVYKIEILSDAETYFYKVGPNQILNLEASPNLASPVKPIDNVNQDDMKEIKTVDSTLDLQLNDAIKKTLELLKQ